MPAIFVCNKCGEISGVPEGTCTRMLAGVCGFALGNYEKKEVSPTEFEELMKERTGRDNRHLLQLALLIAVLGIFVGVIL